MGGEFAASIVEVDEPVKLAECRRLPAAFVAQDRQVKTRDHLVARATGDRSAERPRSLVPLAPQIEDLAQGIP